MPSNLNPAPSSQASNAPTANGAREHIRRESAVSLSRGPVNGLRAAAGINFGSVADQNSVLSSSPAAQPPSGQHLKGSQPTQFGSLAAEVADSKPREKVMGFKAGSGGSAGDASTATSPSIANTATTTEEASAVAKAAAPKKTLDFNKLFQGNGSNASSSAATPAVSNGNTASASPVTSTTAAAVSSPQQPHPPAGAPAPVPNGPNRPSALRAPAQGPHAGARSFEPQRSPSHPQHQQARGPSGVAPPGSPFQPQQYAQPGGQQPRSPHLPQAQAMHHPMHGMQSPPWAQGHAGHQQFGQVGQQMYYPQMYQGPHYHPQQHPNQPHPQHWAGPGMPYDMPRSPRNVPASPMGGAPNGVPGTPGLASPAANRAVPAATPTGPHPSQLGMGPAPGARPQGYSGPSGGYSHSPSASFNGGNPMSPSARQFEPSKRISSAIAIVNPETRAEVDVKPGASGTSSAAQTPTSSVPQPSTPTTSVGSPSATPAAAPASAPAKSKITTTAAFQAQVQAAAAEAKRKKAAEAAAAAEELATREKEAAAAKKAAEEEEAEKQRLAAEEEARNKREAEEKAEAAAKEAEEKAAAERKEREEREAEAKKAEEKAAADRKEREEHEAKEAKAAVEREAKAAAEAQAAASKAAAEAAPGDNSQKSREGSPRPTAIDLSKAKGSDEGEKKLVPPPLSTRRSVADIERIANEASSMPPTPLDAPPRTPAVPNTPRTPGTPGFGGLPAKPMSAYNVNTPVKLDAEAMEKRKRPGVSPLDLSTATKAASADAPMSAALQSLGSARFIEDISKVSYPAKISSPKPELNESAEPGKFRYDRDFLLQFMGVFKEKPQDLPPLSALGMDSSQAQGSRAPSGRRTSGMGPPAPPGRAGSVGLGLGAGSNFGGKGAAGGMGQFAHPKTSEERFAASSARGQMGNFGGPMGSFNAGARSQPLSRPASGSNAIPSRDMMGSGMPAGGSRSKSGRGRAPNPNAGRGGGPQVNPPEKGGPTIPMDQVAPLAMSENRWQGGRGAAAPKADSPEMVTRKVKALLNKLTLEKFDSISSQILEWANKSTEETDGRTLRQVIALIFEKATDEAAFSEMYARLCRKLMEEVSAEVKDENLTGSDSKPVTGGNLFRKYLINRCQEDFERGWAQRDATLAAAKGKEAEDKAKKASNEAAEADAKEAEERGEKVAAPKEAELLSEEYYAAAKAKRRGLGLVRFIGELYKLSMLTERIMHLCVKKLLHNTTDPEEEEIESLCKLLTTVGSLLDTPKAEAHIDIYFQRMREMKEAPTINSRMAFMLQDVIELRVGGWVPRHDNSAPKTIAEIHEDAAKQKAQSEAENAARAARGGPIQRGGSRRGQARGDFGGPGAQGPDGWNTVPAAPRQSKAGDLTAFGKVTRSDSNRPIGIGPQSVFARKNQKSEDGSNPPSRTNSSANMFSLLNQTDAADPTAAQQNAAAAAAGGNEPQRPKLNLAPRTKPMPGDGKADDAATTKDEAQADEAELSDEEAKRKISNDVKEFIELRDVSEGKMALESLPSSRRGEFVAKIVEVVLNKKQDDVRDVCKLFTAATESDLISEEAFVEGLKDQVAFLDDLAVDIPQAYTFVAMLVNAAGLPQERIESLADTIEGDGLKPPKQKFLEKIESTKSG
ncbi:eukaryotic initiation factor 4f subunit p130 [Ceraceosorus bombacis]|uniref:Eukaryotic initiation factor 4f subunit p130 n=1 Tax=Ceraceosorus bombacis TaxID=401625 RepID=A0A0P1B772_9BASI|nr:eukaryotic initiation factor 4f subunit p130 [Ceraceosorus bombacis]